jgi:uncharacterized protein (TIGR02147 family)
MNDMFTLLLTCGFRLGYEQLVEVFETDSYRSYLNGVLVERSRVNSSYSLRGFAKSLGLQASELSEILRGKRKLSDSRALQIADRLDLDGERASYFRLLVQLERSKDPSSKRVLLKQLESLHPRKRLVRDLSVDQFMILSDWFHFAILKFLEIPGVPKTPLGISKALGLHHSEVEVALERLARLELVAQQDDFSWAKTTEDLQVVSEIPNRGLRNFHQKTLEKAIESLDTQSPSERYSGTETIAFSSENFDKASRIFEDCFQKILKLSRKPKKGDRVYHLALHFFALSKAQKEKSK